MLRKGRRSEHVLRIRVKTTSAFTAYCACKSQQELHMSLRGVLGFAEAVSSNHWGLLRRKEQVPSSQRHGQFCRNKEVVFA